MFKYHPKIRHVTGEDYAYIHIVKRWFIFEFFVCDLGSAHPRSELFDELLDEAYKLCSKLNNGL